MSIADILQAAGVIAITSLSQMSGIIQSTSQGKASIVNVYSEYCGYSQKMASNYANRVTLANNIGFYGVDTNKVEGLTSEYNVLGVPAFIGYACGKEFGRVTGADEDGLSELLTKIGQVTC